MTGGAVLIVDGGRFASWMLRISSMRARHAAIAAL
jgi:hypothetical protein